MRAFVTGGTGFIGRQVVRQLIARGYEVTALTRDDGSAAALSIEGARIVRGDITDASSLRPGMRGSDVVFHLAAWGRYGARDSREAEAVNVDGTRNVLALAHTLGVPRIVYTSTVAVLGNTRGQVVSERHLQPGPFLSEYDRTKWLAHYQVAFPLMIWKSAPIVVVMPGGVYGPGANNLIGDLMARFYQGRLPVLLGPETTFTYAHVADIAEGHILAAEQGAPGESYILSGPAVALGKMVELWASLTGQRGPRLRVPARVARRLAPLAGAAGQVMPLAPIYCREALAGLGATYLTRAAKAQADLGWQPRPLESGMRETFGWIAQMAHTPRGGRRAT